MQIIMTVAGMHSACGGPSRTVSSLLTHLGRLGCHTELLTLDFGHQKYGESILPSPELVKTHLLKPSFTIGLFPFGVSQFRSQLEQSVRHHEPALIHDHGIWASTNHIAAAVARKTKTPLIVSPRGMLTKWALNYKKYKKQLAWQLYQRRDLQTVSLFHATSESEAMDLRSLGLRQPIAIIPNGVDIPSNQKKAFDTSDISKGKTALFLSRIHPKKGLLLLIEAWAQVRPKDWSVVIAGPDEIGHRADLEAAIRRNGLERDFSFLGEINDSDKWNLYCNADLFILPTLSENFGVVIAEALACGLPVITTKGAPWNELVTHKCGWWVDINAESIGNALREATGMSQSTLQNMGHQGIELIENKYSWTTISKEMKSVYEWILGDSKKPDCVIENQI